MRLVGSGNGVRKGKVAKTLVKIAGVVAIAAFFSAFYCWGFWDVMGAMKRVPVGIVNLDEGASVGGKTMNLGADIVEAAQESEDATFVSLDKSAMDNGIEASGYLIVFEIPSDFSQRVASGQSGLPSVADLTMFKNERYNFIYSQFASRITGALETSIYQQIAKAYTTGAYEGLFSARDGFSDAAAGMQKIEGGASDLADGLASAAAGARTASEGAFSLASGSAALASGVGSAAGALDAASSGASQLKSASSQLGSGLSSLSAGLSDGSAQLSGAQVGLETLSAKLDSAGDTAGALASGAAGAKQCYQAAQAAIASGGSYGGLTANEWVAQGDAALDQVAGGASELAAGLSEASDSSGLAARGVGKAASQLDASVAAIGSADVHGETLAYAAGSIDAGLSTLTAGLAGSRSSMEALRTGAEAIASGNSELAGKLPVLTSGLNSAQNGSAALVDGSSQLQSALSEGAGSIGENLHAGAEEMGEYVASPTETVTKTYGELDYYGQGFSPFFMTTALWLGSLLIFFVIDPLAPKAAGLGRFRTVLGRLPLYMGMCLLEAAAVVASSIWHWRGRRIRAVSACVRGDRVRHQLLLHADDAVPERGFRPGREGVCGCDPHLAAGVFGRHVANRSWRGLSGDDAAMATVHIFGGRLARGDYLLQCRHGALGSVGSSGDGPGLPCLFASVVAAGRKAPRCRSRRVLLVPHGAGRAGADGMRRTVIARGSDALRMRQSVRGRLLGGFAANGP